MSKEKKYILISSAIITKYWQMLENAGLKKSQIEKLFKLRFKLEKKGIVKPYDYPTIYYDKNGNIIDKK